ncbi:DUF4030 domain-containing protein [Priestia filamentosa]|uniref:DUF4030 domain-containing protein n=1 Tax=Priestia filamentosa TaxID=1402861 RepID=UPI001FB401DA|nr:DUF4030 domain-containing protein [Priestia filamentosa]UOE58979.1 DUF4030 domain-containing protein [Priestia filamentosa]
MKKQSNSHFNEDSLKRLNKDLIWDEKQKQKQKDRLMQRINHLESSKRIPYIYKWKQNRWMKRVIYSGFAFLIFIGLLISSAFVSPAMAQIVSKIPYLNALFEAKPLTDEITEALDEKGYKWDGVGVENYLKQVSVMIVGSDEYYNEVKSPVKKVIQDILDSRGYDAYKVKVTQSIPYEEPTSEEKKQLEEYNKIYDVVLEVLKRYGYDSLGAVNNIQPGSISFELPNTEKRTEEIKKQVANALKQKQLGDFSIKVHTYNPQKREREARWSKIVDTISNGLISKKEYKVEMVGYSNKPTAFTISIETSVSSTDSDAKDTVDKIEKTVQDFLHSKETKQTIGDDAYQIIIYSKDKKKLNES